MCIVAFKVKMASALVIVLLGLAAAAPPGCDIYISTQHVLELQSPTDARLLTRLWLSYVRIGASHQIRQAVLTPGSAPELVMPSSWYRDTFSENGVEAYAGCAQRLLTNVALSSELQQPVMTMGSLNELTGGCWMWNMANGIVFSGEWAKEQFDIAASPYNGLAAASGCAMFDCVFDASLDETAGLRARFAADRAGIGILASVMPSSECVTLTVMPGLKIHACRGTVACRSSDMLCVNQLYFMDESPVDILIGHDMLADSYLMFYNKDNHSTVAQAWSAESMWDSDATRTSILCALMLLFLVWVARPMAADVESPAERNLIHQLNLGAIAFIVMSVSYLMTTDMFEDMRRSTGKDIMWAATMSMLLSASILALSAILLYLRLMMPPKQARNQIRTVYSALLCETILLVSLGSADTDVWFGISCSAPFVFFAVIPGLLVSAPAWMSVALALASAVPAMIFAGLAPAMDAIGVRHPAYVAVVVAALLVQGSLWAELEPRVTRKLTKR
jgi:hypothetical protein